MNVALCSNPRTLNSIDIDTYQNWGVRLFRGRSGSIMRAGHWVGSRSEGRARRGIKAYANLISKQVRRFL